MSNVNNFNCRCCPEPFIDVTFHLVLERQAGFYVYNVILPAVVVTIFALINFLLPDVTGSRMGLIFDCFLAITVTYMMVGDKMPVSSDSVPIVAKLMMFCMSMMVLTVVCSSISMRLRIDTPMPMIVRAIVIDMLGPLMLVTKKPFILKFSCMQDSKAKKASKDERCHHQSTAYRRKERKRMMDATRSSQVSEEMEMFDLKDSSSSGYPETSDCSSCGETHQTIWDQHFSSGFSSMDSAKLASSTDLECLKNVESLVDEQNRKIEDENTKDFWRCVSQIADRIFLIMFMTAWILMVIVLFFKIPKFAF